MIGADFVGTSPSCLVLGDNLLYGHGLSEILVRASSQSSGARVFAYRSATRSATCGRLRSRRPSLYRSRKSRLDPKSGWAVIGLYFYEKRSSAGQVLKPSARGEYEITDLNNSYMADGALQVEALGAVLPGSTQAPTPPCSSRLSPRRPGRQAHSSPAGKEIAFTSGWISPEDFARQAKDLAKTEYGQALTGLLAEKAEPVPR